MAYRQRDELVSTVLDEEEVQQLAEARAQGATLEELAKRFDVHKNTVRNILRRLGNQ